MNILSTNVQDTSYLRHFRVYRCKEAQEVRLRATVQGKDRRYNWAEI